MSEPKLISPMLDDFIMGGPISDHHGVCCCPAIENETDNKYIVKVISVPASPAQMDALLLSGAYSSEEAALEYFRALTDDVVQEVSVLENLAQLEGFLAYSKCQVEPMESGKGFDVYLLSPYKRSLQKHFKRHSFTHLDALNLGLDLCAALSVARRSGYLYVDLKPSNVFVTDQRLFRVGDLGFIKLDSLQYASVPEKYLSTYTPPEIRDAFSALNTTMDTYAAGLILYQVYNNGELPFNDELQPGDTLPAPLYADYEMSEIILKACNPNPDERWQNPTEMGQAIISYMQRNGANDTPIVPMPEPEEATEASEEAIEESEPVTADSEDASEVTEEVTEEVAEEVTKEVAEVAEASDEETENLSFLDDADEVLEEFGEDAENYETLTEEVSEMLSQADELAAADVPEPVVVPDHVDVPVPEPVVIEEEEEVSEPTEEEPVAEETEEETAAAEESEEETDLPKQEKKRISPWLYGVAAVVLAVLLLLGGIFFYRNYYILPIDSISVEGNEDVLVVYVSTSIDESLLQVICSDTYGNQLPAPVIDGKAEFTGLVPNTAYSIKVVANGFHRLTGKSSTAYSTPIQTNIVQFDAVTGITDGSVILSFAVEGPDCKEWTVVYSADGEEERSATFTTHMVTLTDLTIGKDYTFRLVPDQELYVTGQKEISFTARKLVRAENLEVISCVDSTLTASWSVPEGENVSSWSVRCFNDNYNQTIITTDTTATFKDLDHTLGYTVEVKAAGMSVSQATNIAANSITAGNFTADTSNPNKFTFTWQPSQDISEDGWILRYTIDGFESETTIPCNENTAVISPVVPNATYRIRLEDASGNVLLGSKTVLVTPAPADYTEEFEDFSVTRADLEFKMCRRPHYSNWDRYDVGNNYFKAAYASGEKAAFLVNLDKKHSASEKEIAIVYVIRNEDGAPVLFGSELRSWENLWYKHWYHDTCELNIPVMPTEVGTYTMDVYFNNGLVHSQEFTIVQ